jgi:hypothetical protein
MKVLLRFFISFFVLPKNIILYYWVKRKNCNSIVRQLHKQGMCILEDRLTKSEVEGLVNDYQLLLESIEAGDSGQLKGRVYKQGVLSPVVGTYVDRFLPIAVEYFNNKDIDCELTIYQKSLPEVDVENIPGGEFHMDDNKKNLKFFIYLKDVALANGPFAYVKNSHGLLNMKKLYKWWLWEITSKRKYLYTSIAENKSMRKASAPVLGKSGTIFCADTTGYHSATPVKKGGRLVMVISFAETRANPYYLSSSSY